MTNEITPYEIIQELGLTGLDATICKINPEKYIGRLTSNKKQKKTWANKNWEEANLSFSHTTNPNRAQVTINVSTKTHCICNCFYSEKQECIELFKKLQNNQEVTFEEAQKIMKDKFNLKRGGQKRKSSLKVKTKKGKIPKIQFSNYGKGYERIQASINTGKHFHICTCLKSQKQDVEMDYIKLVSSGKSLEEIQETMRKKYNARNQCSKTETSKKIPPKSSKLEDFTVDKTGCILHKGKSIRLHYSALNELVQMKKVNGQSDAHIISWYHNTNPKILRMLINNVDTKEYWDLFHKLEDDFCKLRGF